MDRVAVLVDAGYFFAAGSALVSRSGTQKRGSIIFNEAQTTHELKSFAQTITGGLGLLRIYWYDGASRKTGLSADHERLARASDVKVRLGFRGVGAQPSGS